MSRSIILATMPFDGKCQNLQMSTTNFSSSSYRFRDIKISIFYLQKVKVIESNFLCYTIRQQKSNSTHVFHAMYASSYRYHIYNIVLIFISKKQVKIRECNFRIYTIRLQISKSTNVSHMVLRQFLPFQIYKKNSLPPKSRSRSRTAISSIKAYTIRWQMSKSTNFSHIFLRYLLPFLTSNI